MKRFGFSKNLRLVKNEEFRSVIGGGKRSGDGILTMYAAKNDRGFWRLGVSVSRQGGTAVERNRLKRRIRETMRINRDSIPQGYDYVFIGGKKACQSAEFAAIRDSVLKLVQNAGE